MTWSQSVYISHTSLPRNPYSLLLKPLLYYTGAGSPILWAENQSSSRDSSAYPYPCAASGFRLLIGVQFSGMCFMTLCHSPQFALTTLGSVAGVSTEPSMATLASPEVSLPRSPTPQLFHWSMRICHFLGPSVGRSGKWDTT